MPREFTTSLARRVMVEFRWRGFWIAGISCSEPRDGHAAVIEGGLYEADQWALSIV